MSAIVIVNQAINVLCQRHLCTSHNAVATIETGDIRLTLVSSYFQFSEPTQDCVDALESILDGLSGGVIVCADVNARSTVWYDRITDTRGDIVVNFISRRSLALQNKPGAPTFRNRGTACLD